MVFQFLYKPDLRQPRVTLGQVVSVHNCPSKVSGLPVQGDTHITTPIRPVTSSCNCVGNMVLRPVIPPPEPVLPSWSVGRIRRIPCTHIYALGHIGRGREKTFTHRPAEKQKIAVEFPLA